MRALTIAALAAALITTVFAEISDAQFYQRNRGGMRGAFRRSAVYQPHYYGGFAPYYPPVTAGSWYTRPYPHHFDYYRWRYSAPPVVPEAPFLEVPAQQ